MYTVFTRVGVSRNDSEQMKLQLCNNITAPSSSLPVGHGRSEGYRLHVETYDTYTTDVIQHVEWIRQQYPELPSFLMGHSMVSCRRCSSISFGSFLERLGLPHSDKACSLVVTVALCLSFQGGLIAVHVLIKRPELFKGAVLSAPLMEVDSDAAGPIAVSERYTLPIA